MHIAVVKDHSCHIERIALEEFSFTQHVQKKSKYTHNCLTYKLHCFLEDYLKKKKRGECEDIWI